MKDENCIGCINIDECGDYDELLSKNPSEANYTCYDGLGYNMSFFD